MDRTCPVEPFDGLIEVVSVLLPRFGFSLWFASQLTHGMRIGESVYCANIALPWPPMRVPSALKRIDILTGFQINPRQQEM